MFKKIYIWMETLIQRSLVQQFIYCFCLQNERKRYLYICLCNEDAEGWMKTNKKTWLKTQTNCFPWSRSIVYFTGTFSSFFWIASWREGICMKLTGFHVHAQKEQTRRSKQTRRSTIANCLACTHVRYRLTPFYRFIFLFFFFINSLLFISHSKTTTATRHLNEQNTTVRLLQTIHIISVDYRSPLGLNGANISERFNLRRFFLSDFEIFKCLFLCLILSFSCWPWI